MKLGKFNINLLDTGIFALDGGAMFGVIPKALWSKQYNEGDSLNRIPLSARPLLIRYENKNILVDTGNGDKMSEKTAGLYNIDLSKSSIVKALSEFELKPEDITDVILTHLHFDHTGGSTIIENGEIIPTFKNARYYIQKDHFDWAYKPTEKDRGSFLKENFDALTNNNMFEFVEGNEEIFPGISVINLYGHTKAMQSVKITAESETAYYCADLSPTAAHLGLAYSLAYDNFPLQTIEDKKMIYPKAVEENWTIIYEHDAFIEASKIIRNDKGNFVKGEIIKINE
jgi:glyoxylase-like metal-dependent hydrolase (beta-lactamase superfamily II)